MSVCACPSQTFSATVPRLPDKLKFVKFIIMIFPKILSYENQFHVSNLSHFFITIQPKLPPITGLGTTAAAIRNRADREHEELDPRGGKGNGGGSERPCAGCAEHPLHAQGAARHAA